MTFYATKFIYDGVPSDEYGLIISSSGGGESSSSGSNGVEIVTQEIFRRHTPYFYGVSPRPVMEFEVEISTTENEITAEEASQIQSWLFGSTNYKKLRIQQPDMEDYYYNCILNNPKVIKVGNIIRGFTCDVICDSPFAWGQEEIITISQSNRHHDIYNKSEYNDYTYPKLIINMNGSNGNFLLRNVTDNNREFSMTNLLAGETVTIDGDRQIVTATGSPNILDKINSPINFFRLLKGYNKVFVEGNFVDFDITYVPIKRMV